MVKLVQGLQVDIAPEDVAVDPPGKHLKHLVTHMHPSRHSEDVVKFFQSPLFSLRDPQEDHNKGSHVQRPEKG